MAGNTAQLAARIVSASSTFGRFIPASADCSCPPRGNVGFVRQFRPHSLAREQHECCHRHRWCSRGACPRTPRRARRHVAARRVRPQVPRLPVGQQSELAHKAGKVRKGGWQRLAALTLPPSRPSPTRGEGVNADLTRMRYARPVASRREAVVLEVAGREVAISNPGKVYFPEAGITKLEVVRYYVAVAEGALRGAGGRPNVLVRYADGIHGEFFYQKRAPDSRPDWVEVVELAFPSGRTAHEVVPRDAKSLAWMVNLG